jgi:3'(2'), 5'-bisphosphate nucleotidase
MHPDYPQGQMQSPSAISNGELQRLAAVIADLASEAGARILAIAEQGAVARAKADMSPVTVADEAAEAILCEGLAKILPGVPVIAEEAVARLGCARPDGAFLLVDPIDGTKELIAGRAEYTVNVALIVDHAPALGLVYAPGQNRLYLAARGQATRSELAAGARFDAARATPIRARKRPKTLAALVSRSHPDAQSDRYLATLPIGERIALGSSLKFARLAEGAADIYVRLGTVSEWDIAAGHALLEAAGGGVTAPDGAALRYGLRDDFRVNGFVAWGAPAQ